MNDPEESVLEPYDRHALSPGDEVWVRATVGDPCTSCAFVRINTIHGHGIGSYVFPSDLRIARALLAAAPTSTGEEGK